MNPRLRMLVKMQQNAKVEITHIAHDQITEHALSRNIFEREYCTNLFFIACGYTKTV
jgi:hypothetical protein